MVIRLKIIIASLALLMALPIAVSGGRVFASELTEDYVDMSMGYAIGGDYREALKYIYKILQIEPGNPQAKQLKETLEMLSHPTTKSFLHLTNPQLRQVLDAKAVGDRAKEYSMLKSAVNLTSNNFWANYFLAEMYREDRDYKNAIDYYNRTLQIKSNFVQCYLGIAISQYESGNYPATISVLNEYLKHNPQSDFAYALRAKANMERALYYDAENDINKALSMNDDINYRFIEGKILYQRGHFAKARRKLETLTKEFQTAELYKYIGLCDYAAKDYPSALLNLEKAIILSDEDRALNAKYNEVRALIK